MWSQAEITHSDNGDCKAAMTFPLFHATKHLVHQVVLVRDYSLCTAVSINPSIRKKKKKNNHIMHNYVHVVAIPISEHYFLLSHWLILSQFYRILFWRKFHWFSLNCCDVFMGVLWNGTPPKCQCHTLCLSAFLLCSIVTPPIWFFWDWDESYCNQFLSTSYHPLPAS